jgi:hypothetical protein
MLVDLVEMRSRGVRIERDTLKLINPHRGLLSLTPDRPGRDPRDPNPPLLAGLRRPGEYSWIVPPLDKARVVQINPRGMVIRGRQELQSTRSSRSSDWFDQAWWVRVVPAADPRALEFEDVQSVHLAY